MNLKSVFALFIALFAIALFGLGWLNNVSVAQANINTGPLVQGEDRYVSTWTTIDPGQTVGFAHGLGVAPLELDIWVNALEGGGGERNGVNSAWVVPIYEKPELRIVMVSNTSIAIQNMSAATVYHVQVVARP